MTGIDRDGAATAALSTTAPNLAPAEVRALVRRLYDVDGSVQSLAGERDQNCLVEAADGSRYVLKISNPAEPASVVDFQIAALDHVARCHRNSRCRASCGHWMGVRTVRSNCPEAIGHACGC